jgi:hypothetical protein
MSESLTPQRDDLPDLVWLKLAYPGQKRSPEGGTQKKNPLLRCYTSSARLYPRRTLPTRKSLPLMYLAAWNACPDDSVFLAFSVEKCR